MAFTEFFWLLILLVNTVALVGDVDDFETISQDRIQAGKTKLEEFTSNAKSSDCWKKAIEGLEKRCRSLGDIEQSYLAIDFTNCHLLKSGRNKFSCSRRTQIKQCIRSMDNTTFLVYTTFFAHTTNICFYVKSELWQQSTEYTISKLKRTSQDFAAQLEESTRRQIQVLEKQNVSLEYQKEIISNEMYLTETLKNSTLNAKQAFEDMKQSAQEQKDLFSQTFDDVFKTLERVRKLQSIILGEFISLLSLAFYIAALCTCYFFTSIPRTAAARLPLFIGLFVLIFIERLLISWGVTDAQSTDTENIYTTLKFCRWLSFFVALFLLIKAGYQYQDYNKINFDTLHEIEKNVKNISMAVTELRQQFLQGGSSSPQSITHPSYSNQVIPCDKADASSNNNINAQNLNDDDDEHGHSLTTWNESAQESFSGKNSKEEKHSEMGSHKIDHDIATPVSD